MISTNQISLEIPDLAPTSLQLKIPIAISLTVTREITNVLKTISIHWKLAQKYYAKCSLQFISLPPPKNWFCGYFCRTDCYKIQAFLQHAYPNKDINFIKSQYSWIQFYTRIKSTYIIFLSQKMKNNFSHILFLHTI
jgi:hypothetical protein